jgi:hypothetical protein
MTIELVIAYKNPCKYDKINIVKIGLTASTSKEQKHFNDKNRGWLLRKLPEANKQEESWIELWNRLHGSK